MFNFLLSFTSTSIFSRSKSLKIFTSLFSFKSDEIISVSVDIFIIFSLDESKS